MEAPGTVVAGALSPSPDPAAAAGREETALGTTWRSWMESLMSASLPCSWFQLAWAAPSVAGPGA